MSELGQVLRDASRCTMVSCADRLQGGGAAAHQVLELEARFDALIGSVGDAHIIRRARARPGDLQQAFAN